MIITKKALPRRTFLRGMGVTLALPFLDAMAPSLTAAAPPARRLGFIYIPMGCNQKQWFPTAGSGRLAELTPTLNALTPFADQLIVGSNYELKNGYSPGNHATANASFLSASKAKMTEGSDYFLATTVDQIAAKHLGQDTKLPSLEMAMDLLAPVGSCDNGYACVYQNNLSWSSPTTPLQAEANPRVVFERLFGDGGTAADQQAALRKSGSILDWVNEDMSRLQRELGASDRSKVSEYMDTVRELERRIQTAEAKAAQNAMPDLDRPLGVPAVYADHAKLMFDLQILAMRADVTRVFTLQLARETSTRTYPEVGVPEAHHPTSHHTNNPEKLEKLAKINAVHISLYAYLLDKLKSTKDGDGSLLDHSLVLYGSGMGDPDVHNHINLPILVAGGRAKGKGALHIKNAQPAPLANLHLTLLDRVGVHQESFADSTGTVSEVPSVA
ncbi:MAG: DUF1552 domain-containing protein [Bryobacterales bacterium]|nr:DUF1552 domain-containing protein [Bryobacterales bacterium]